jgi:hypothetical protein
MQAITTLLVALSCGKHFEKFHKSSVACSRKLIRWLRAMGATNDIAKRAYVVLYSMIKTSDSPTWAELVDMFPDEVASQATLRHAPAAMDQMNMSWMDEGQPPTQSALGHQSDEHDYYQFRHV